MTERRRRFWQVTLLVAYVGSIGVLAYCLAGAWLAIVWDAGVGIPLVILAVTCARRAAAMRRFRDGKCPVCRYDLAMCEDDGCPECGWMRRAGPDEERRDRLVLGEDDPSGPRYASRPTGEVRDGRMT